MPLIRKDAAAPTGTLPGGPKDLSSPDGETRWAAVRHMARDPANVGALGKALAVESDPRIREALFTGLAQIRTPEAIGYIVPHIRSQDAALRAGALDALSAMPEAVESHLPVLLADPDPDVRLLVCDVVRRLPGPAATRYLCDLLAQERLANVCGAAVDALSEVGDETALPVLADCAARFSAEPFLVFSIKVASSRIAGDGRALSPKAP
jgi:HEAT repeat protein